MRIVSVHHGQTVGGALLSLLGLIRELNQSADVEFVVLCVNENMARCFREKGHVRVESICDPLPTFGKVLIWGAAPLKWRKMRIFLKEFLRLPASIAGQRRCFRKVRPDVVHLNSSVLFSSAIAARMEGIPVVWHVREMLAGGPFSIRRGMVGWLIRWLATRVVAISPATAACLGSDRRCKVDVIYNPVDMNRLTPDLWSQAECRARMGFSGEHKVVLTLGGVSHWKGTAPLIDAMSHVDSDTHLLIAGPTIDEPNALVGRYTRWLLRVEDVLVRLKLQSMPLVSYADRVRLALRRAPRERIHFLGVRDDVPALIAAADVLAFAGMGPHFARPIFEAWAMKKPVVVFRMSGVSDHVGNGVDGVVVRERSGRALGLAIQELLANSGRMRDMGARGYEKARQLTNPAESARRVGAICREVTHASAVAFNPSHARVMRLGRLAYYKVEADSDFWDQHWRSTIRPELYTDAKLGGLVYYEVPFTRYLPPNGKILEAGCGTGYYVAALRARGYDVEGVDFAPETIAAICRACPGLPVSVADVTKLSVADGYYKAYISLGVMEHRQEGPEPFLSEAYRVLCPGGVALISVPWMHTLRRCKAVLGLCRGKVDGLSFYQYAYDHREMRTLITAAGFEVIELYPYDGYKGLKDEIPALRRMLTWRRLGWRMERYLRRAKWLDRGFGHMMLYVCRRTCS